MRFFQLLPTFVLLSLVVCVVSPPPPAPQASQTCQYNCHPTDEYNNSLASQMTVGTNLYCYYPSIEDPGGFCRYSATVSVSYFKVVLVSVLI
jgi:hypothetical protein